MATRRSCLTCGCQYRQDDYNSLFMDSDPRTSEPNLWGLDSASAGPDVSVAETGDSIPLGGTCQEITFDPEGHEPRWLERPRSFDRPFNSSEVRQMEEHFAVQVQTQVSLPCSRVWRLRRLSGPWSDPRWQAEVWFIAGQGNYPQDRTTCVLNNMCCKHFGFNSGYASSELEAIRLVCASSIG